MGVVYPFSSSVVCRGPQSRGRCSLIRLRHLLPQLKSAVGEGLSTLVTRKLLFSRGGRAVVRKLAVTEELAPSQIESPSPPRFPAGEKVPKADEGAVLAMPLPESMFGCDFAALCARTPRGEYPNSTVTPCIVILAWRRRCCGTVVSRMEGTSR